MSPFKHPNIFLKQVLRINAIFSMSSGILIIVFSSRLAESMGLFSDKAFGYMGPILCCFALYVWICAIKQTRKHVRMIIIQDLLWVMGSLLLLLTNPFGISVRGLWLIAIVALIVLDFALLQSWGLRSMDRSAEEMANNRQ